MADTRPKMPQRLASRGSIGYWIDDQAYGMPMQSRRQDNWAKPWIFSGRNLCGEREISVGPLSHIRRPVATSAVKSFGKLTQLFTQLCYAIDPKKRSLSLRGRPNPASEKNMKESKFLRRSAWNVRISLGQRQSPHMELIEWFRYTKTFNPLRI